jgi:DNA-binding NtrC family response regulator
MRKCSQARNSLVLAALHNTVNRRWGAAMFHWKSHPRARSTAISIALIHGDRSFRSALAAALRGDGYEVAVFDDAETANAILPAAEKLNIRIIGLDGRFQGVRLVVISIPETAQPGEWGAFLAAPVANSDVVRAIRRLAPRVGAVSARVEAA